MKFNLTALDGHAIEVEAEREGEGRYLIRMSRLEQPTYLRKRVGMVLGREGNWIAESVGAGSLSRQRTIADASLELAKAAKLL